MLMDEWQPIGHDGEFYLQFHVIRRHMYVKLKSKLYNRAVRHAVAYDEDMHIHAIDPEMATHFSDSDNCSASWKCRHHLDGITQTC